jgi:hypothetical protein
MPSLTGMAILLAGVPVYLIWGKRPPVPVIPAAVHYDS